MTDKGGVACAPALVRAFEVEADESCQSPEPSEPRCGVDVAGVMRAHPAFAELDAERFGRLLAGTRVEEAEPGRVFFHRGDSARHFYVVLEGRVNLSVFSRSGVEKVIEFLGPCRIFGEIGMFSERGCYAVTAVAASRTRVARVPNRDYLAILQESPAVCLRMLAHLAERIDRQVQQIECATLDQSTDRLIRLLEARTPCGCGDGPFIVRCVETRQELASFLSMKPETLSRALRCLVAGGAVVVNGRDLHVPSRARLLSLLGGSLQ